MVGVNFLTNLLRLFSSMGSVETEGVGIYSGMAMVVFIRVDKS